MSNVTRDELLSFIEKTCSGLALDEEMDRMRLCDALLNHYTLTRELEFLGFAIYDSGDDTYYYGDSDVDSEWGNYATRAFAYPTHQAARAGLDEVDCENWLRDAKRLKIVRLLHDPTKPGSQVVDPVDPLGKVA